MQVNRHHMTGGGEWERGVRIGPELPHLGEGPIDVPGVVELLEGRRKDGMEAEMSAEVEGEVYVVAFNVRDEVVIDGGEKEVIVNGDGMMKGEEMDGLSVFPVPVKMFEMGEEHSLDGGRPELLVKVGVLVRAGAVEDGLIYGLLGIRVVSVEVTWDMRDVEWGVGGGVIEEGVQVGIYLGRRDITVLFDDVDIRISEDGGRVKSRWESRTERKDVRMRIDSSSGCGGTVSLVDGSEEVEAIIKRLVGDGVWEDTYLAHFSGGLDRSSSSSVAPIPCLPPGLPFLLC